MPSAAATVPGVLVLGLDTATDRLSVGLYDGSAVLVQHDVDAGRRQAELLAPTIAAVLAQAQRTAADLTQIAVGVGPGPFTGLRVGLVTARVLGLALGIPVVGICSLDPIAHAAAAQAAQDKPDQPGRTDDLGDWAAARPEYGNDRAVLTSLAPHREAAFAVVLDARRGEVYWAAYDAAGRRIEGPEVLAPPAAADRGLPVIGAGAAQYPLVFAPTAPGSPTHPDAGVLAELAVLPNAAAQPTPAASANRATLPELALPPDALYLRRPDAQVPGARKRVLPPG